MSDEAISWDETAATWDDDADVRLYCELALGSLQEHVAPLITALASTRVLDFGCGTGLLARKLAPHCAAVVAVDASHKMIEVLQDKLRRHALANVTPIACNLETADAGEFDALTQPFDLIVASSVCAFLGDYEQTLAKLAGLLKPSGLFVQWDWLASAASPVEGFSPERIAAAYAAVGLQALRIEPAFELEVDNEAAAVLMGVGRK